jgi:hypothetical protein
VEEGGESGIGEGEEKKKLLEEDIDKFVMNERYLNPQVLCSRIIVLKGEGKRIIESRREHPPRRAN